MTSLRGIACALATPRGRSGAIALIDVWAGDGASLDAAIDALFGRPLAVGDMRLADLLGIDRGLLARPGEKVLQLMPHGGPAVVGALLDALADRGIAERWPDAAALFPEARDEVEAEALLALSRAASPRACGLLLAQRERWLRTGRNEPADATDRALDRLLTPPTIVAVGPPNVGKSTLLNRLAGDRVSREADAPGTTLDHVGAMVVLDGLAAWWIDAPGYRTVAEGLEREALALLEPVIASADLVVVVGDRTAPIGPVLEWLAHRTGVRTGAVLRVAGRADLGSAGFEADCTVAARDGMGLEALAVAIRRRLVPDEALASERPWRFFEASAGFGRSRRGAQP